jgi:DNA primase
MDAVKQLAEETGLELPTPEPEAVARQERATGLHEALEAAARHFAGTLVQSHATTAREYLKGRQVSQAAIADFRLGYAPNGRQDLKHALKAFPQQLLVDAGLLISVEGKEPYDRFRDRLMVPIKDPRGRVIAFGGRLLGLGEPKYLNSPDTPVFDKGRVLFNLDRAGPASRQAGRVIVVEGYFDVIALDQVGIREAVAPMGTALTEAQLEILWRLVDEPILCFDGDSAGRKAAERASVRAMPSLRPGKQLRIVLLPHGADPDDLVRTHGRDIFEEVVQKAVPLSSFLYASERDKIDVSRPEQRASLRQRLEEVARQCEDRFVAEEFSRSFKDSFYEDFGWKKKQADQLFRSSIQSSPRVSPDLARLYIRSALYGLSRFPSVAAAHLEEIGTMAIAHPQLQRWRDAIGEAVISQPGLTEDGMCQILDQRLVPEVLRFDIRQDLRFGFTQKKTPDEVAIRQLETLITFLAHERRLKDEMEEYDALAVAAVEGDKYVAIESQRQRLREARAALFQESANWDGEL